MRNYVDVCSATSCDLSGKIFPPQFPCTTRFPPSFGSSPSRAGGPGTARCSSPCRSPGGAGQPQGRVRHGSQRQRATWDTAPAGTAPFSASPESTALGAPALPFTYPQPRPASAESGTQGHVEAQQRAAGKRGRPATSAPERIPAHRLRKGRRSAAHRRRVTSAGGPLLSLPAAVMPKLSKEAKQRLQQLFKGGQFAIRWGFIPVVLYLGQ